VPEDIAGIQDIGLSALEVLTTTRAVRRRLDLQRPVARELISQCIDVAVQAPNASNRQHLAWVVVDDPATRAGMADIYRSGMALRSAQLAATGQAPPPPPGPPDAAAQMAGSSEHLAQHMHEVPVLVVATIAGRLEGADVATQAARWGSVLPAVWNFMLALRRLGVGSAWTTVHLFEERRMASLLGIPYDDVTQAGLFPVAHTIGTAFKPGARADTAGTVRWNHW
jgi:nitroreductase